MASSDYCPPEGFWPDFVGRYWERVPTILKPPCAQALMTEVEAFELFVRLAARFRVDADADIDFYIERGLVQSGVGHYLPRLDDGSIAGYVGRVNSALGGLGFMLATNSAHESIMHRRRIRWFARGLLDIVGTNGKVRADVFLSTARSTPFGIHKDSASTFAFVLSGRKRMLLWPDEVFVMHPAVRSSGPTKSPFIDEIDVEAYRADATVLEGGPGEVLYWPSSYWHVAEAVGGTSGEPALVFGVPIYLVGAEYQFAIQHFERLLRRLPHAETMIDDDDR